MSTLAIGMKRVDFQWQTPICGNCQHERRARDEVANRTNRSCGKHLWFVLLSGTCKNHAYRQYEKKESK